MLNNQTNRRGWIKPTTESRRSFLKTTSIAAVGAGSFALGVGATAPQCGGVKNLSTYVQMIAGGFTEIKVLLPDLGLSQAIIAKVADLLDKGVKVAADFDKAYRDGKFTNARTLFTNLGSLVTQVITTLGVSVDNRGVKIALAAIGIARVAVAIILDRQLSQPSVAAEVQASRSKPENAAALDEVKRLANTDVSGILALLPR